MKYIFTSKSISFKKEDTDGSAFLCIADTGNQLFVNSIGNRILTYLPEYDDTEEVVDRLSLDFPQTGKETLRFDLLEIMRIFEIYGVVNLIGSNNANPVQGVNLVYLGDINYTQASNFICEQFSENNVFYSQVTDENYFSPVSLRYRVMHNYEYAVMMETDAELVAYVSVSLPQAQNSRVLSISSVFVKKSLQNISKCLDDMIQSICKVIQKHIKVSKIRIALFSSDDNTTVLDVFSKIGFVHECTLSNEVDSGDLLFYSRSLE